MCLLEFPKKTCRYPRPLKTVIGNETAHGLGDLSSTAEDTEEVSVGMRICPHLDCCGEPAIPPLNWMETVSPPRAECPAFVRLHIHSPHYTDATVFR